MKKIKLHMVSGNVIITTVSDVESLSFKSPRPDAFITIPFGKSDAHVNMRHVEYIEIEDT